MNERLSYIDFRSSIGVFRVVAVYMPHCGYADSDVDTMYSEIEILIRDAKRRKINYCICGDFNAEVGTLDEHDESIDLGPFGISRKNVRGDWLLKLASKRTTL